MAAKTITSRGANRCLITQSRSGPGTPAVHVRIEIVGAREPAVEVYLRPGEVNAALVAASLDPAVLDTYNDVLYNAALAKEGFV